MFEYQLGTYSEQQDVTFDAILGKSREGHPAESSPVCGGSRPAFYGWLVANAWRHKFYQLKTET